MEQWSVGVMVKMEGAAFPILHHSKKYSRTICLNKFACNYTQVRGFAPIGMLECWNIGRMGFGLRLEEGTGVLG